MTWTTQPRSKGAGDLSYWHCGAGQPVVLIHGVGLRAEAWGGVMPALAPHHSVYAIDMPGHGGSPLGPTATLEDFADRISAFVAALGTPVAVAGHSMGAILSLMLAARLGARITAVAALNAIYRRTPEAGQAVRARAEGLRTDGTADPTHTLERWFGNAPTGPLAAAHTACGDWLRTVDPLGYKTAYQCFANQDGPSDQMLADLAKPALFMTARHDRNSTPAMSQAMAAAAPFGTALIVEDAAHMMPMTHAGATADALLSTFQRAAHV